ncbi:hypothetical protein BZL30_6977 [Mycobacterium kansasii]|uniref:Uncharacterized protein n=1 Tax=Mycobacterium kansasii TaxID=1768 RepID=A0A1V3WQB2_MYCKA|nr:hypothetical protein BZL30_6977 [Mycobacterium kansasii]
MAARGGFSRPTSTLKAVTAHSIRRNGSRTYVPRTDAQPSVRSKARRHR